MKNLSIAFLLASSVALTGCPPESVVPIAAQTDGIARVQSGVAVAIVLDSSGSMDGDKATAVKNILSLPIKEKLGMYAVMGNEPLHISVIDCGAGWGEHASILLPMSVYSELNYQAALNQLSAGGGTPLGQSLNLAYSELNKSGCAEKHIFVLSDGQSGDDLVVPLQNRDKAVALHVIGFQTDVKNYDLFVAVGGQVIMADDAATLDTTTNGIFKAILKLEED